MQAAWRFFVPGFSVLNELLAQRVTIRAMIKLCATAIRATFAEKVAILLQCEPLGGRYGKLSYPQVSSFVVLLG